MLSEIFFGIRLGKRWYVERRRTFNSFHILELLFQAFGQQWTLLNLRGIGVQHLESIFFNLVMPLNVVFLSSSKSQETPYLYPKYCLFAVPYCYYCYHIHTHKTSHSYSALYIHLQYCIFGSVPRSPHLYAVLGIRIRNRIRILGICMFLGLPDPLVRGMNPDSTPSLFS